MKLIQDRKKSIHFEIISPLKLSMSLITLISLNYSCSFLSGIFLIFFYNRDLNSNRKRCMLSSFPFLKLKGLLAPKISKFTKICKFQKKLYANLRLLNDYGLIISIQANKEACVCVCVCVCVCFIFKIGDATSTRIYFPILVHELKQESRFVCL